MWLSRFDSQPVPVAKGHVRRYLPHRASRQIRRVAGAPAAEQAPRRANVAAHLRTRSGWIRIFAALLRSVLVTTASARRIGSPGADLRGGYLDDSTAGTLAHRGRR